MVPVDRFIFCRKAVTLKQVIYGLLNHRFVQVVAFGKINGLQDTVGLPLGSTPIQRFAPLYDVMHGPYDFINRGRCIITVAIAQVYIIKPQA